MLCPQVGTLTSMLRTKLKDTAKSFSRTVETRKGTLQAMQYHKNQLAINDSLPFTENLIKIF